MVEKTKADILPDIEANITNVRRAPALCAAESSPADPPPPLTPLSSPVPVAECARCCRPLTLPLAPAADEAGGVLHAAAAGSAEGAACTRG
jgi:hypothetical protein